MADVEKDRPEPRPLDCATPPAPERMGFHWNKNLRDRPVGFGFRACAALFGLTSLWQACSWLSSYIRSGQHNLWGIGGLFLWSLLWLWPAATGYVFPQWRRSSRR
jgi:hypothetical protein